MDYRDQIEDLLSRAEAVGHGPAQVALTEQAVRLADGHQDIEAGYFARLEHVSATMFAGRADEMLVAFSWLLARFDEDPESFELNRLLWQYKWVVSALPDFPQITVHQINDMFNDMGRRYRAAGASLQAVHLKRRAVAMKMGMTAAAEAAHRELQNHRRDDLSDCHACEIDAEVEYHFFLGDDERGAAAALPILRGKYACGEVPHLTYAQLLLPLLRLGRGPEAMAYHRAGYRLIARNPGEFIPQLGEHIRFLALTDNIALALRLVEKHLALGLETVCVSWQFDMFLAVRLMLDLLMDRGVTTLRLRLPETFPERTPDAKYDSARLRDWFASRLTDLATRFDTRNANTYYHDRISDIHDLKRFATAIPLPKDEERRTRWERG